MEVIVQGRCGNSFDPPPLSCSLAKGSRCCGWRRWAEAPSQRAAAHVNAGGATRLSISTACRRAARSSLLECVLMSTQSIMK